MASTLAKSLLIPKPGAGLVSAPVRPFPKPAGPDRLAKILSGRISAAYTSLPNHERLAAALAVEDTFAAAGPLDAEQLFALDLDPARVRDSLGAAPSDLTEQARDLYADLLTRCCAHLVEQLTAHPSFAARAAVEQTRRAGRAEELLRELRVPKPEAVALGFEERYARFIAETHGRMELYGITLGNRSRAEWSLDTAYISLAVSGQHTDDTRRDRPGLPQRAQTPVKVEQVLADCNRLVLLGPAGSGKSTLVQWLALNAARRSFGPELADWNRCVPFVLRLRSFNTLDEPPRPGDFLPASGVPLDAPYGWVEDVLVRGRGLVLVDGVDEVPRRLRIRTEKWLKKLIAAFPRARYVVTMRPSAVREDWLAGQGFTAHSLLPMERHDIRAFIGHWHDSARQECLSDVERDRLDTCERGLVQAVATRRDLGRLATNPLMCALLCALNHDRRMQLPRARKELYDAALDMLLVRRDTEREITDVEGVTLSREEQTALLQRLAYWLIRNGQMEAFRADAIEMIDEWLAVMPQVREQGDAAQVFSHLLIRSGLLREPVPGSVDFVHRTFRDYLGAKAAVEARDFGVLALHAHHDQWDDVVRMAVGHARVEERGQLLRQLLERADSGQRYRQRLVLLAATCLQHAPELDPAVRAEVEALTGELMPPRSLADAAELAKVGELVLELLPGPDGLDASTAAAVVCTATLIGGDSALGVITRFRSDTRPQVGAQLAYSWSAFDTQEYAETVLAHAPLDDVALCVRTSEEVAALKELDHIDCFQLMGEHGIPEVIASRTKTKVLFLTQDPSLHDLSPLAALAQLKLLGIYECPRVHDLGPLRALPVRTLYLEQLSPDVSLAPLAELQDLAALTLGFVPAKTACVADIPAGDTLTRLGLHTKARKIDLDGIERWPALNALSVSGYRQTAQLARLEHVPRLKELEILQATVEPAALARHHELAEIALGECELGSGLEPLTSLTGLRHLRLSRCTGSINLAPLAGLQNLTVSVLSGTRVKGAELFPPERLKFTS
ncbi:NACHT domain-containing protein [Streptomyces sp. HC44]|uniref:NACHT domain-containing protein n=1 Tax=Streptomyces scabichelini TaxID=2711217 RepID=A0A6G4V5B0_9ACTN|nr:NACHT domain-containing protein [Streptomyces scabichelini]